MVFMFAMFPFLPRFARGFLSISISRSFALVFVVVFVLTFALAVIVIVIVIVIVFVIAANHRPDRQPRLFHQALLLLGLLQLILPLLLHGKHGIFVPQMKVLIPITDIDFRRFFFFLRSVI